MRHLALIGAFAALCPPALAQDQLPPTDHRLEVGHFSDDVEIDGQLDDHLQHLPAQTFGTVFTYGNPDVDAAEISYRVGYSDTHFYVFIQTDAERVVEHRRGWLWGDGFRVVLTQPEDEGRSPHFYDIGYSPNSFEGYEGFNQVLITYNHQPTWRRLSENSRSIAATNDDGTGFEAIIA